MSSKGTFLLSVAAILLACQAEPRFRYVPLTEPEVELLVRASAVEVSVGEAVVLYAERRSRGEWKQVEKSSLTSEQCWLGHHRRLKSRRFPTICAGKHFHQGVLDSTRHIALTILARSSSRKRAHSRWSPVPQSGVVPIRRQVDSQS